MINKKKSKVIAGIIAVVLVITMIGGTLLSAISMAQAASISSLKGQLSDIGKRKAEVKELIKSLEGKIDSNLAKKDALVQQMKLTQEDINATKAIIEGLEDDIEKKEEEIVVAQEELDEKTDLFETRIRVMYESGSVSYLDVLLGSDSFSDMLSNLEFISQIMDYDKKVVAEYQAAKDDLEEKKATLVRNKTDKEEYHQTLKAKYDSLDDQKSEIQEIINTLEDNADQKRKEEEKLDAEKNSINNEIERLSRIEAEQARKRAEEAKKKEQSSSGNKGNGGGSNIDYSGTGALSTWPLPGYGITCSYGWRKHPIYHTRKFHKGADIAAPGGVSVKCAGDGTVVKSYLSSSYGNYVVVSHGNGVMSAYAHLSRRSVSVGDRVSAGQQIGLVGSTGNSTGNHLHFEIYINGSTVNPANYYN